MNISTHADVVAIVPARGGSKGIPRKNLAPLCGQPLLYWTVRQLQLAGIPRVAVSTDDGDIGTLALELGADFLERPAELSGDEATSESAVIHAIEVMSLDDDALVVMAQPTSPLRLPEHIVEGIEMMGRGSETASVFSAVRLDDICLWRGLEVPKPLNYDQTSRRRRQDARPHLVENGSFYVFTVEGITRTGNRLSGAVRPILMPKWSIHEIDESADIAICESLMQTFVLDRLES